MEYPTVVQKIINADPDTFVIFYVASCPYCQRALALLRKSNVKYKGYIIDKIPGGMNGLLQTLIANKDLIQFNVAHHTKPIIFYNNRFLGGSDELFTFFSTN